METNSQCDEEELGLQQRSEVFNQKMNVESLSQRHTKKDVKKQQTCLLL